MLRPLAFGRIVEQVLDGDRRGSLLLEPVGGPQVQVDDRVGFDASKLADQELAEQRVVAVPLAAAVERHQEGIGCLEPAQHLLGITGAQHGIAERRRESIEHRGAAQESLLLLGHLRERLAVEVVGDIAVVARDREGIATAVSDDRRREEQADRPALGAFDDLDGVVAVERHVNAREDLLRARRVEGEIARADLEGIARGAKA